MWDEFSFDFEDNFEPGSFNLFSLLEWLELPEYTEEEEDNFLSRYRKLSLFLNECQSCTCNTITGENVPMATDEYLTVSVTNEEMLERFKEELRQKLNAIREI